MTAAHISRIAKKRESPTERRPLMPTKQYFYCLGFYTRVYLSARNRIRENDCAISRNVRDRNH